MNSITDMSGICPLVVETRCGVPELLHSGTVVIASEHEVLFSAGDGNILTPTRSTLKPFILGCLLSTILKGEVFDARDIAVMSSSHDGEPEHVQAVRSLLERYALSATSLRCGRHPKFSERSVDVVEANNCSGKHAALLIASKIKGWDMETYAQPGSEVQNFVRSELLATVFPEGMRAGIDGCSIPNYAVSATQLARAYARLASDRISSGHSRVRAAHRAVPELMGGEQSLDTHLVRNYGFAAKSGSDGVWAVGIPAMGLGIAVKVYSGSEAAAQMVVLKCLRSLGALKARDDHFLSEFEGRARRSWSGVVVGEMETCFPSRLPL